MVDVYIAMEETLQIINKEYVSLSPDEMKINNQILHKLLDEMIEACLESSDLFSELYGGLFFGGSYYDGLKINRPDEYDICVKLYLRNLCDYRIISSNKSGYVHVKASRDDGLHVLVNEDGFLDTEKLMLWMHQILSTWLGGQKINKARVARKNTALGARQVELQRHGPAFTFCVRNFGDIVLNFDFVPCFVFDDQWPRGFKRNIVPDKREFYLVPKPPKDIAHRTRYFRTSFQEQDREILHGLERLKPALRLVKKMRDKLQLEDVIVSFFIKNVFLWKIYNTDEEFWNLPLSYVFMEMIKVLHRFIRNRQIVYFWHRRFNLIEHIDEKVLDDIALKLGRIISNINNNPDDEFLIARYLLSQKEMKKFRANYM